MSQQIEEVEYSGYKFGGREGLTLREKIDLELNITTPVRWKKPLDALGESKLDLLQPVPEVAKDVKGTEIQETFRGVSVLVTGGTGFIGKVLLEKLLRSMPHIRQVYVLIREKKGKSAEERMAYILDLKLFRRLKIEKPTFKSKITVLEGDCDSPNLGLKPADRQKLIDNVGVIFHVAATTNFTEPLRKAVQINLTGTLEIIKLVKELKHLKAFVHVSSAYVNSHMTRSKELFYPLPHKYQDIINLVENETDEALEILTPSLLGKWANTYVFTKALAEAAIVEHCQGMPVAVFRPSIVCATYREPVRGWAEISFGIEGLFLGVSTGVIHTALCHPNVCPDFVPVDFVVNAAIATAWNTATAKQECIPVYNYTSHPQKPFSYRDFETVGEKAVQIAPSSKAADYPWMLSSKHYYLFLIMSFFIHTLKGYVMDFVLYIRGQPLQFTKIYKRVNSWMKVMAPFSRTNFYFENDQTQKLWKSLSPQDKDMFLFDINFLDFAVYFETQSHGLRYYVLNETIESLPDAKNRMAKIYAANCLIFYGGLLLLVYIVICLHKYI